MKNLRTKVFSLLLTLALVLSLSLPAFAAVGGAGTVLYSNRQQLTDSLAYIRSLEQLPSSSRVNTYALDFTPGGDITPIVMACDTIYGGLTVSEMISYASSVGYNVVAAVNSDFYDPGSIPTGVVVENGIYKSSPEWNSVYGFFQDGSAFIEGYPTVNIKLGVNGSSVSLTHFNKMRVNGGGLYMFSSAFSTVSTRTSTDGWMVRFRILEGQPTVSGTMTLEVTELIEGSQAVKIGDGNLILTADTTSQMHWIFEQFSVGDRVTMTTSCSSENLINAQWAGGGGDVLISGGAVTSSSAWQNAPGSNPRTAMGIRSDGSTVCLVADGRSSSSAGYTLSQLASELLAMGCVSAVNLDGGGSSVIAVQKPGERGCSVMNVPSDGSPRRCAEYILFVTNQPSDGSAKRLYLNQDGVYVLTGASVGLSYSAMDSAYEPVGTGEVTASSSGLGFVSGSTYTAGQAAGLDTINLSNGSATGTGTIHVVDRADTLYVSNADTGAAVSSITIESGKSINLRSTLYLLGRTVNTVKESFTYSVSGDVGTVDASGRFTAADNASGRSGSITVSAGGLTKQISVKISSKFADCNGHWAESYIYRLFDQGIIHGTSESTFSPGNTITRADFVVMLYRAAGKPAVHSTSGFSDVSSGAYYSDAITWASSFGIVSGIGEGKFAPLGTLTREQAFAIVYRALGILGISSPVGLNVNQTLQKFSDNAKIASYAREGTAALVNLGIVSGVGDGTVVNPTGSLTRAETATVLCSVLDRAK